MRKSMVEASALAALLLGVAVAWAQQPAPPAAADKDKAKDEPAKSKLEEMLEKALHDNPDVLLAQAKLAEAEAELTRARLLVVRKVAVQYHAIEAQKAAVQSAAAELEIMKQRVEAGAVERGGAGAAEQKLIDAKAKLASLEAELPYLLGKEPSNIDVWLSSRLDRLDVSRPPEGVNAEMLRRYCLDVYGRLPTPEELAAGTFPRPAVQGPTADRIRGALDKPFSYATPDGTRIVNIVLPLDVAFKDASSGLTINFSRMPKEDMELQVSSLDKFDKMPIGAALEWLEDTMPDCRVAVRDYGLVIAPKDALPPGAPLLHDFWKRDKADEKNPQQGAKDEPAKPPTGLVKDVDEVGRVHVNIGKNDGLAKGDVLTVIRQESEVGRALLVGRVRVVELGDGNAVAEPFDAIKLAIVPGDKVRRDQGK